MLKDWSEELKNMQFRIYLLLSFLGLALFVLYLPYFFNHVLLDKPGVRLNDPILSLFTPHNWSTEIFIALYFCTAITFINNFKKPKKILVVLQVYVVVNFLRIVTLYLFTLEAPEGIIPLNDPFLTKVAYGQPIYVKDLFFSGHVSLLFLLFLLEERHLLKWILFSSTIIVAVFLAWQRVHYSIDLLAAPVITLSVFQFFNWFNSRVVFKIPQQRRIVTQSGNQPTLNCLK